MNLMFYFIAFPTAQKGYQTSPGSVKGKLFQGRRRTQLNSGSKSSRGVWKVVWAFGKRAILREQESCFSRVEVEKWRAIPACAWTQDDGHVLIFNRRLHTCTFRTLDVLKPDAVDPVLHIFQVRKPCYVAAGMLRGKGDFDNIIHATEDDKGAKYPSCRGLRFICMKENRDSIFRVPGPRFAARPLELLSGVAGVEKVYKKILSMPPERGFFRNCADAMGFDIALSDADKARLPTTGPVVITANHPSGMTEGVAALAALREIRPDVKALGMTFLSRVPEMAEAFFSVDVFSEGASAASANRACVVQAVKWLEAGHAVLVFPAGVVAHRSWRHRLHLREEDWQKGAFRLAAKTGAKVVPVGFGLRNRFRWHLLGLVHPLLRTINLPNEFLANKNRRIPMRIGEAQDVPSGDPAPYMRVRSLVLAKSAGAAVERQSSPPARQEPVAGPVDPKAIERELAALPGEMLLIPEAGPYKVWLAPAKSIPLTLAETGRLREITFRANNEGTGKARDLDAFDNDYLHLVLWDSANGRIAGGSRLGDASAIVAKRGVAGLYTRSLFEFDIELVEKLDGAFELGRTFIDAAYQRDYMPLYLLWKAMYVYFNRRPEIHTLFGTVSISASTPPTARALMAAGLMAAHGDQALAALVKSPNPPRKYSPEEAAPYLADATAFARIVRDATPDGKGFPVLLRHYLKLGGRFAAFSEDPLFGDCLDGFVFVDLSSPGVERFIRMMGKTAERARSAAAASNG